eukprot:TRINITY_DN4587_c0_g1_i1.p1 TRINITY_DN4587_c0_g1~~TRINITY_DN4587_c0_g1_i1.p1  ORF type:complete len:873 (-),score=108.18 TRINITY_DN4587_c0_g1_i1:211-2829(-)
MSASFRVRYTAEVRQTPQKSSALFHTLQEGKVVKQCAGAITLSGGQVRVPIAPRGWVDAEALELLEGTLEHAPAIPAPPAPATVPATTETAPAAGGEDAAAARPRNILMVEDSEDQSPVADSSDRLRTAKMEAPPIPPRGKGTVVPPPPDIKRNSTMNNGYRNGQQLTLARPLVPGPVDAAAIAKATEQRVSMPKTNIGAKVAPKMPVPRGTPVDMMNMMQIQRTNGKAFPMAQKKPVVVPPPPNMMKRPPPELMTGGMMTGGMMTGGMMTGHGKGMTGPQPGAPMHKVPPPMPLILQKPPAVISIQANLPLKLDGRPPGPNLDDPYGLQLRPGESSLDFYSDPGPLPEMESRAIPQAYAAPVPPARYGIPMFDDTDKRSAMILSGMQDYSAGSSTQLPPAASQVPPPLVFGGGGAAASLPASLFGLPPHGSSPAAGDKPPSQKQVRTANLNRELQAYLTEGLDSVAERDRVARSIRDRVSQVLIVLGHSGNIKIFGSFATGFKTGTSDIDIACADPPNVDSLSMLGRLANTLPQYGFRYVSKIFQSSTPLVKFTDAASDLEVDFCISNPLGMRNSSLLNAYCEYDSRVIHLGRLVKDWAKQHELVGTADGYLNSYAYILLTIHYLQAIQPPVAPNLQLMADGSYPVVDNKWGCDDRWETTFKADIADIPPSTNTQSLGALLIGFFKYYGTLFDWQNHAVCIRLNRPGIAVDKFSLVTSTHTDQWYVEDPFDLKHNLGGKCSPAARARVLEHFAEAYEWLSAGGSWREACLVDAPRRYYLKCRINKGVTAAQLIELFGECELITLHYPKTANIARLGQVFLEFASSAARRQGHSKNEMYIGDCQLLLHYTSSVALHEALNNDGPYATYNTAA